MTIPRWAAVTFGFGTGFSLIWLWNNRRKRYSSKSSMDFVFEFGETEEAEAFFNRHPNFYPDFERLTALVNKCFARPVPKPYYGPEYIRFSLSESCREDFLEILFLAANDYGDGASNFSADSLNERWLSLIWSKNQLRQSGSLTLPRPPRDR
jgi:hypothetical protein